MVRILLMWCSRNAAGTWTLDTAARGKFIVGSSANDITIFSQGTAAYHYNGTAWTELVHSTELYPDGAGGGPGASIAVGGMGGLMICNATTCGGSPNASTTDLVSAWVLNDKQAFVVGALGTILY